MRLQKTEALKQAARDLLDQNDAVQHELIDAVATGTLRLPSHDET
jgi:hypothetical protein